MSNQDLYKPIAILLAIAFLLTIVFPELARAQTFVWRVQTNPSAGSDYAYAIAEDGDYIYIAGTDQAPGSGDYQWRIEKRRKSDGGLESGWPKTSNPCAGRADKAHGIVADSDPNGFIYIAGQDSPSVGDFRWRIEKRRKDTGALVSGWPVIIDPFSNGNVDIAYAITEDANYIYVAGSAKVPAPGDYEWWIEKRRKSDGGFMWKQESNPNPTGQDHAYSITAANDYIYIAGCSGLDGWRVEKRRKSDGGLEWQDTPYLNCRARSIVADDDPNGYVYVGGSLGLGWLIEKRRKSDGWIEWTQTANSFLTAITADSNYIYTAGFTPPFGPGDTWWRIEKRKKSDGELVSMGTSAYIGRFARGITNDQDYLYIAGDYSWHIEKWTKLGYVDIGLRVYDQNLAEPIKIAAWPLGQEDNSPLRIAADMDDNGTPEVYGIVLVDPGDAMDSGVRIRIGTGASAVTKALGKF